MRNRAAVASLLALGVVLAGCQGKLRRKGEAREESAPPPAEDAYYEDSGEDDGGYADDAYADQEYGYDESGGYASEADRTAAMESRAAEAQSNFQDAMANARTPEEKAQAYQEYEAARRDVNRMAEDEGGGSGDSYGPPP